MSSRAILPLAGVLIFLGCAKPRPVPVVVKVPVPVPCPEPPRPARPVLPIAQLRPGATVGEVLRAYVATVRQLQGYSAELEALLDAYRAPAPSSPAPTPEPQ